MKPPFRADQVGSLLRPASLARPRAVQAGPSLAEELRAAEDDSIRAIVGKQASIGLRSITDGELRRDYWHIDFLRQLDGVAITVMADQSRFAVPTSSPDCHVTGKWLFQAIMADAFAYLHGLTAASRAPHRQNDDSLALDAVPARRPQAVSSTVYADLAFLDDSPMLSERDWISCRARLHLPAARRRVIRLSVRSEIPRRLPLTR